MSPSGPPPRLPHTEEFPRPGDEARYKRDLTEISYSISKLSRDVDTLVFILRILGATTVVALIAALLWLDVLSIHIGAGMVGI